MMKTRFSRFVILTLSMLLVSACASQTARQAPLEEKLSGLGFARGEKVRRINDLQINSWNLVDRKNVVIYVGAGHRYLITTRNPCDGLEDTEHLNYSTTAGNLTDKDKLMVRRLHGHVESCFIDSIYELEKTN